MSIHEMLWRILLCLHVIELLFEVHISLAVKSCASKYDNKERKTHVETNNFEPVFLDEYKTV